MLWWLFRLSLVSAPVLCVAVPLRWILRQEWPRLRQTLYFPLSGHCRREHAAQRQRLLRRLNAIEVELTTADGRRVHCVWATPRGGTVRSDGAVAPGAEGAATACDGGGGGGGGGGAMASSGGCGATASSGGCCATASSGADGFPSVALLLHANAMVLDDMADWAQFYLSLGCSVLILTFWGYPPPTPPPP